MTEQIPESEQPGKLYKINLEIFEGPLDLLLHLIKKNEVDIFDIPIAEIARQYMEYIALFKELNVDLGGEFLVMASTLALIKSKNILPDDPLAETEEEEDEEELKEELVRRLLDYQRYKEVASDLTNRTLLNRDIFARKGPINGLVDVGGEEGGISVSMFELFDAFQQVLKNLTEEEIAQIELEEMSVKEKIMELMEKLLEKESFAFHTLFKDVVRRIDLILTFLAILEMARLRIINVFQNEKFGAIQISIAVRRKEDIKNIIDRLDSDF